ncbi:MAG: glycosyltransferase [bacterium]
MPQPKTIAIVHYRVGRTDGVSLEIEKRRSILEGLGHEVKVISGPVQNGSDFVIEELEFDTPGIKEIKENSFKYFGKQTLPPQALLTKIHSVAARIKDAFLRFVAQQPVHALLLHNIFSHGRHIAAASAFADIVKNLNIPVISTNHDYYWERIEYQEPACEAIGAYLHQYVPPNYANITHVSINSLAQKELKKKKGIDSVVFPDVFDFKEPPWRRDDYNADFLAHIGLKAHDLIVLHATRIVERKAIELAIQFVKELSKHKHELIGRRLYNGKILTKDSSIVLVLAGYCERSAQSYLEDLKSEIAAAAIGTKFVHHLIAARRRQEPSKLYSLWDAYVFADLVTYTSLFEGWGNQFIEAVFARKPVVLFEYPVFKADIQPQGYAYVSLGDTLAGHTNSGLAVLPNHTVRQAVGETLQVLTSEATTAKLNRNFQIGSRNHDYDVLKRFLANHIQ